MSDTDVKEKTEEYLMSQTRSISAYQLKLLAGEITGIKTTNERVAEYVVEHLNREYQFIMRAEDAADDLGITRTRVSRALQILSESDPPFLVRIGKSCYQINPDIIDGMRTVYNADKNRGRGI